jgi:DNA-binding Lrp family transcriptional regulator
VGRASSRAVVELARDPVIRTIFDEVVTSESKNSYGFIPAFCETARRMSPLIKLLLEGGKLSTAQMAQVLNLPEAEINRQLEQLRADRVLLGWRPVLNLADEQTGIVRAVIEVRITPERGGGFNRHADRISRFDEVESCYLMSGGYDLLVFVSGTSLQKVAAFVSEKLSTIEGVLSTATHFLLRSYKEQGFLLDIPVEENNRLKVAP